MRHLLRGAFERCIQHQIQIPEFKFKFWISNSNSGIQIQIPEFKFKFRNLNSDSGSGCLAILGDSLAIPSAPIRHPRALVAMLGESLAMR